MFTPTFSPPAPSPLGGDGSPYSHVASVCSSHHHLEPRLLPRPPLRFVESSARRTEGGRRSRPLRPDARAASAPGRERRERPEHQIKHHYRRGGDKMPPRHTRPELKLPTVVWTSLGPIPRWVPGTTTRWAPGTTRLALHGTRWREARGLQRRSTRIGSCTCPALCRGLLDVLD
jgi:hypothetical protein